VNTRFRSHVGQPFRAACIAGLKPCPTYAKLLVALSLVLCLPTFRAVASQTGSTPAASLQQIAALLERSDLPAAKRLVDSALREHPLDPALHNAAGVIDAQQGAIASAEQHFLTAIRLAPQSSAAYENLGRLYQEQSASMAGARQKALDTYERLLAVNPENVEGLYQRGFLLALNGEFAQSRALIQRLPDAIRRRPQVLAVTAIDLAGLGDLRGAATAIDELTAHAELTAEDVRSVIPACEHLSDDAIALRLLEALDRRGLASAAELQHIGRVHARDGRFAEARAAFERSASLEGPSVTLLLELARAAVKLGDHKGAMGYLAHARSREPDNANIHFLFGMVCVELNLGAEAHESLKKAVAFAPENPLINYAMGAVSTTRHDPSESLPYFEKYVKLAPGDPRGRFALGAALFQINQFDEARPHLQEAARHPETGAGAHYYLARIARQTHDLETARREIDAALRFNPMYADAWAELGLLQTRAERYTDAEQSLMKALALDPKNYAATVNLTTLFSRTRDPRREAQAQRLAALQEQRFANVQEFLRMIEVVP
jgi:tetratricopeptide (TPR) repeat protein